MASPTRPVVLVTGAARRLGRAIALHLAAQGWDVAVHYRGSADDAAQTVRDIAAAGGRAQAFAADLADEAQCQALLPAVAQHFGRVDAVVNNASLFEYDSVADFSFAAMDRHWRANTAPAVLLARALHAAGGGAVVNLLDQKLWNPNPDYFSYTLSKAALEAATTLLAQALAPRTRICGVAPGVTLVSGPMTEAEFGRARTLTLVHAGGHRPGGVVPAHLTGDHRHHLAGRRWPTPAGPAARRAVPGERSMTCRPSCNILS